MKVKNIVSKRAFMVKLAITLLFIFAYTIGLTTKIYIGGGLMLYSTFFIAILILAINSPNLKRILKINKIKLLIPLIIFCIIINNAEISRGIYERFMFSITFFVVYFFISDYNSWISFSIKMIKMLGILYASLTIFLAINPDIYINIVMPLFEGHTSIFQQKYAFLNGYLSGFTPNAAINAIYIVAALGVYFCNIIVDKRNKYYDWLIFLFLMAVLLMTGKRGHFIFCLITLSIVYFINNRENIIKKYLKYIIMILVFIVGFFIAVQYIPSLYNVFLKFQNQAEIGRIDSGRFEIWKTAFDMFLKSPLWGYGWDSFKYIYEPIYGSQINVHNVYIQLLFEVGILGTAFFCLFFKLSLTHTIRAIDYFKYTSNNNIKKELYFSIFIQVFFLLYCLTGNPLYDATSLFLYILACAIGEYYFKYKNYEAQKLLEGEYI